MSPLQGDDVAGVGDQKAHRPTLDVEPGGHHQVLAHELDREQLQHVRADAQAQNAVRRQRSSVSQCASPVFMAKALGMRRTCAPWTKVSF